MPLTNEDIKSLLDRNDSLKNTRSSYKTLWDEISEFIFPRRLTRVAPGQKKTTNLYDSTAVHANELLAASMHGTLTPSSSKWFSLKLRDDRLNKIKEVQEWLEDCADKMYLAFHQSNFNSEIHEIFLDLGAFGTGCLFTEEKPISRTGFNGLQFKAFPNTQYCTAENAEGMVDTMFREFRMSARAASAKWGEGSLGEKVKAKLEKKPDERFTFLHCVFPTENGGAKPYSSYYLGIEDKNLIAEGGYYEFPYHVPRWTKDSGEDYGTGPGHTALPDTKTLNKAKEFGLKAWAKDLDPPTFEKDGGVIGSLKLYPGGRNIARDKESVWTLDHNIRYDVSQIKEEELRQSIRQIFYSDQLKLQEGPEMTATEVHVRYELMQRLLGPTIGRLESELLNPLIERVFGLMLRASSGRFWVLPPIPRILLQLGITDLDIEYEGPLAKAQRTSEMVGMQRLFNFGVGIAEFRPDVLDNFDTDDAVISAAEIVGAPARVIRSREEVADIRDNRRRLQIEERQKQDMERLAAGIKDITPAGKLLLEEKKS